MKDCSFDYKSANCLDILNKVNHKGTAYKFNAIENYASSWIEKIYWWYKNNKMKLSEFIFVDPMASSGEYSINEDTVIEGTAMRIIKLFENCSKKENYGNIKFTIYLNDITFEYLKCIRCSMERNGIIETKNFSVIINNNNQIADKDLYLADLLKKQKFLNNDSHRLVIYDPYDVDFNWDILGNILKINSLDLILTHFYPNDVKRNIHRVVNEEAKMKYSKSYLIPFKVLEEEYLNKKSSAERSQYLRNCLENAIRRYTNSKIHTSPIFNSNKIHVYDIVCISRSLTATSLLKDIMFRLYSEEHNFEQSSMTLFSDETYIDQRNNGVSEFDLFYSQSHIVKNFWERYNGKTISKTDLNILLKSDPIFPSTGLLSAVKKRYGYTKKDDFYTFEVKK